MRAGIVVNVTRADRHRLEAIVSDRCAPQKHVWRAQILLATAAGCGTAEIMRRSGKAKPVVWTWQARFMEEGVDGLLRDKTRKPGKAPLPAETVQLVFGPVTRPKTSCTVSAGSGALPGLRVLSRSKPSTPSSMNRACQVHTTGFALPDRRMISAVPQPAAVARRIWARHTCFCGAQRSETIASSRWRSARVTLTTIPALMTRA